MSSMAGTGLEVSASESKFQPSRFASLLRTVRSGIVYGLFSMGMEVLGMQEVEAGFKCH